VTAFNASTGSVLWWDYPTAEGYDTSVAGLGDTFFESVYEQNAFQLRTWVTALDIKTGQQRLQVMVDLQWGERGFDVPLGSPDGRLAYLYVDELVRARCSGEPGEGDGRLIVRTRLMYGVGVDVGCKRGLSVPNGS
jgi:hypothetical protein